jgi:hypothetical protein
MNKSELIGILVLVIGCGILLLITSIQFRRGIRNLHAGKGIKVYNWFKVITSSIIGIWVLFGLIISLYMIINNF